MNDDILLFAIDDAVGASAICSCGKELRAVERDRTVWLECPTFAMPSRLPARLATLLLDAAHDRRPVGTLPSSTSPVPEAQASAAAPVARPVALRG